MSTEGQSTGQLINVPQNTGEALVIYSGMGRALNFKAEDLILPAKYCEGGSDANWYVKEWEKLKPIWIRRVMNDAKLQQLSLPSFIEDMVQSMERRFQLRKNNKKKYHLKKKLLHEQTNAGKPTMFVAFTNVASKEEFQDTVLANDIVDDFVEGLKPLAPVVSVLVDEGRRREKEREDGHERKRVPQKVQEENDRVQEDLTDKHDVEEVGEKSTPQKEEGGAKDGKSITVEEVELYSPDYSFDVIVKTVSIDDAAKLIVGTYGRIFGGRKLVASFYDPNSD